MKKMKAYGLLVMALLVLSVMPLVAAVDIGAGIGISITPELFPPRIWMCDNRVVIEDCLEAGRVSDCSQMLVERLNNYAFEGEQIHWTVLVMDKNKIEEIEDVVGTAGSSQGEGNDIEVECHKFTGPTTIPRTCNARIGEEDLTGQPVDPSTMQFYECTFTVEDEMRGEYWLTVEAISADGSATMDENEFWFLNPEIALTTDGDVVFDDVRPGSVAYSDTILVGNDAEPGSGVMLDMFISGTDFYDPSSSGARCPSTNHLKLANNIRSVANLGASGLPGAQNQLPCQVNQAVLPVGTLEQRDNMDHLCYFATQGAYSTQGNPRSDVEGYVPIVYGDAFTRDFYNDAEIIRGVSIVNGYYAGNILSPGAEIALTFKLGLPEPCVGDFSSGDIYFWGEAI